MKRLWTVIGVSDVAGSLQGYQSLLGQPKTPPAHSYFGQILDADGTVLLCLHAWGEHDHPSLINTVNGKPGNGLLLFFRVDDFDMALARARACRAARRRATHEPEHGNHGVLTPGFGRLLRHDQCAHYGLSIHPIQRAIRAVHVQTHAVKFCPMVAVAVGSAASTNRCKRLFFWLDPLIPPSPWVAGVLA
jgi:hypothetical protein